MDFSKILVIEEDIRDKLIYIVPVIFTLCALFLTVKYYKMMKKFDLVVIAVLTSFYLLLIVKSIAYKALYYSPHLSLVLYVEYTQYLLFDLIKFTYEMIVINLVKLYQVLDSDTP